MDQDLIWDYWQNKMPEAFESGRARLSFLVRKVTRLGVRKVLNIGIGSGIFEEIALNRGLEVYSLDPNTRTVENLRARFNMGTKAQVGDIKCIPFPSDMFDAVIVSEVLEHLPDEVLDEGIAEVKRVLRKGGYIIGTVPACEDLVLSTVICPKCGYIFHRWGHLRSFDAKAIWALLSPHFQMLEVLQRPFITYSLLNWKGKILGLFKTLFAMLGLHGSGETLIFIGKKP